MGIARWRAQRRQLPIAADTAAAPDFLVAPSGFTVAPDAEPTPGPSKPVPPPATRSPLVNAAPPAARATPATQVTATAAALTVSDAEFEAALVLDHEFGELDELVEDDPETFSAWVAEATESVAVATDEDVEVDLDLSPAHAAELARTDEAADERVSDDAILGDEVLDDEIVNDEIVNDAVSPEVDPVEAVEAARLDVEAVMAVETVEEPADHAAVEAVMAEPSDRADEAVAATDMEDSLEIDDGHEVEITIEFDFERAAAVIDQLDEVDQIDEGEAEAEVEPEGPMPVDADELERRLTKAKGPKSGEPIIVPGVLAAMWPSPEHGPRDADAAELSRLLFPEHNDKGDLVH
jgi:hypothetical protein